MGVYGHDILQWYDIVDDYGVVRITPPPPTAVHAVIAAELRAEAVDDYEILLNPAGESLDINIKTRDPRIIEMIASVAANSIREQLCTNDTVDAGQLS